MKLRGFENVDSLFVFSSAEHNLFRLPRLIFQQLLATPRKKWV